MSPLLPALHVWCQSHRLIVGLCRCRHESPLLCASRLCSSKRSCASLLQGSVQVLLWMTLPCFPEILLDAFDLPPWDFQTPLFASSHITSWESLVSDAMMFEQDYCLPDAQIQVWSVSKAK